MENSLIKHYNSSSSSLHCRWYKIPWNTTVANWSHVPSCII